jgi:peptide deformylase
MFGDPVLRERATEVTSIDGAIARLADDMIQTMRAAPGIGLAAPQIGVQKRLFVYEVPDGTDGAKAMVNPVITEFEGEWEYEEGCLSVPGLHFNIVRPKRIHISGFDLDGKEVTIEADELEARMFQHELDHLDGVLLLEHLDDEQRREAKKALREMVLTPLPEPAPAQRRLSLRK